MNVFSDKVVKKTVTYIIITFITTILIGVTLSIIINNVTVHELAKYDVALVGAMHEGSEIKDLPIITGEIKDIDYNEGKSLLTEYSYATNIYSLLQHYNTVFTRNVLMVVFIVSLFFAVTLLIVTRTYRRVFRELKTISYKMQVENLSEMDELSNIGIGELSTLKNSINSIILRSKFQVHSLDKDKQLSQKMLADISHQLKTPLSTIRMFNEIMLNKPEMDIDERVQFLNQSKEQIDRIDWLVQGLLKMARIEADSIQMIKKDYCLADTIETAIAPLLALAKKNDIKLDVYDASQIHLIHDTQWVAEALGNIIKNAIEHTDKNGYVQILSEETPMTIEVRIKDNGKGIKEKDLPNIFKRFYHVDGQNAGGAGIGLELAKEILEKNGADIYVHSDYGIGTEFVITFLKKS